MMIDPKELVKLTKLLANDKDTIKDRAGYEAKVLAEFKSREKNVINNIKSYFFNIDSIHLDPDLKKDNINKMIETMNIEGLTIVDMQFDLKKMTDEDTKISGPLYNVTLTHTLDPTTKQRMGYEFKRIVLPYDTEELSDIYKKTLGPTIVKDGQKRYINYKKVMHFDKFINDSTGDVILYFHLRNDDVQELMNKDIYSHEILGLGAKI